MTAIYLTIINTAAFALFGIDKHRARRNRWRISEAALITISLLGGSIGAWLGMKAWHHKTLRPKFKYGIPAILLVQIAAAYFIIAQH